MRRLTLAAAAGWPIFVFNTNTAPAPADYLEQQRCLAILNIAVAAPVSEDPEDMSPLYVMRRVIIDAYDQLTHSLTVRTGLTAEQLDSGMDAFEAEQQHWLDLYGEAQDSEGQDVVAKTLSKKVDTCLPMVSK